MRKLLSLAGGLAMAAAMFMAAAQDTPAAPEALYLVGQFSNWVLPVDGGTEFALTDEDGDGIYTGTYNVAAEELVFKVFSAKTDWSDATAYFGAYGESEPLYSDAEWKYPLYPGENGNWNVQIPNWQGGEVAFSAKPYIMDGSIMLIELNLKAPSQPTRPVMPDAVYCIGSFNDWKTPEGDDLNGAVKVQALDGAYGQYMDNVAIPSGNPEFKFYYTDSEGKGVYVGTDEPSFTLYKFGMGMLAGITVSSDADGVKSFKMRDWTGTTLFATVNLTNAAVNLGAVDGSQFTAPSDNGKFYAVVTLGGQEPKIYELASPELDNDMWTVMLGNVINGEALDLAGVEKVKVVLTSENSVTPSAESCWGPLEDYGDAADNLAYSKRVAIGKGGKAFEFAYPDMVKDPYFSIYMQMQIGVASITKGGQLPKTEIYLVGQPQGWDINSDAMPLKLVAGETDVYEATYEIAAGDAIFRFYEELGNWEKGSIGSQVDDAAISITIPAEESFVGDFVWGKGSWNITDWAGGSLYMKVDMKDNKVTFRKSTSGAVNGIEAAGEVRYFDLQGRRVENPSDGIFIRVESTGKSSKVAF